LTVSLAQPEASTATAPAMTVARRLARMVRVGCFDCKGGLSRLDLPLTRLRRAIGQRDARQIVDRSSRAR
jgi:hypothetical protein